MTKRNPVIFMVLAILIVIVGTLSILVPPLGLALAIIVVVKYCQDHVSSKKDLARRYAERKRTYGF